MILKFRGSKEIHFIGILVNTFTIAIILSLIELSTGKLNEITQYTIMIIWTLLFMTFFVVPRITMINLDTGDIDTSYFGIKHKLNMRDIQEIRKEPIDCRCYTFGVPYKLILIKDKLRIEIWDTWFGNPEPVDLLEDRMAQWIEAYNIKYEEVKLWF